MKEARNKRDWRFMKYYPSRKRYNPNTQRFIFATGIECSYPTIHIPVTGLVLYLNHRILPDDLGPSRISFWMTFAAAIFVVLFSVAYLLNLVYPELI